MSEPIKPKKPLRRRILRQLLRLLVIYAAAVVVLTIFQRRALYFPRTMTEQEAGQFAAGNGFDAWRNKSGQIIGWKLAARGCPSGQTGGSDGTQGSVLIVPGNAGCAVDREYIVIPIWSAAPVDVYVLEYPGYGARGGSPSRSSMVAAGREAFDLLPVGLPIYLVSESIGAGVACELAQAHPRDIAGMCLLTPYHNLAWVAQRRLPVFPTYLLLLDRFNPAECLKDYHGPVKFVVAGDDEVIPPASGKRLFEEYSGPKSLQVVAGARHNDVAAQPADWWRDVFAFWAKNRSAH